MVLQGSKERHTVIPSWPSIPEEVLGITLYLLTSYCTGAVLHLFPQSSGSF